MAEGMAVVLTCGHPAATVPKVEVVLADILAAAGMVDIKTGFVRQMVLAVVAQVAVTTASTLVTAAAASEFLAKVQVVLLTHNGTALAVVAVVAQTVIFVLVAPMVAAAAVKLALTEWTVMVRAAQSELFGVLEDHSQVHLQQINNMENIKWQH
jgi:hypothetical protein